MRNSKVKIVWIIALLLIGFVGGEMVSGRYALLREAQLQAEVMARNGPILASCIIEDCDKNLQQILVQANDTAMKQLVLLESRGLHDRIFNYIAWPVIFSVYSSAKSPSADEMKTYYEKLGCGLDGVICSAKPRDR